MHVQMSSVQDLKIALALLILQCTCNNYCERCLKQLAMKHNDVSLLIKLHQIINYSQKTWLHKSSACILALLTMKNIQLRLQKPPMKFCQPWLLFSLVNLLYIFQNSWIDCRHTILLFLMSNRPSVAEYKVCWLYELLLIGSSSWGMLKQKYFTTEVCTIMCAKVHQCIK